MRYMWYIDRHINGWGHTLHSFLPTSPTSPRPHLITSLSIAMSLSTIPASTEQSTEFPDAQKARLKELLPEYESFILDNDLDHKRRAPALIKWRKDKTKSLLDEPIFQDLLKTSPLEYKDWQNAGYICPQLRPLLIQSTTGYSAFLH
jgi:hypothetical protein